ncbi:NUDIX hydrolase [Phytoactinopolyspora halotolerans]|uniref:NUDIX hydrolase n=1 Tax=Phytoactinopolyspora halotolerans TaxID=1981512 RepID=A0A6L9SDC1_9ACTN|nr:NUDIX hydrolase [Phytoactinopolyspora halotolerans]NEE03375.1 NUDIX hydrolase [Phytoactinopolyspora halotolerans]
MSAEQNDPDNTVRAAGGVVWRPAGDEVEIVVVHRPKYDDWSLPKGKLDPGETFGDAAVREVLEETGVSAELGRFLDEVRYVDRSSRQHPDGRPKTVRYWEMRAMGGSFEPHREVDAIRWLTPDQALGVLTHELDHRIVRRFVALDLDADVDVDVDVDSSTP